MDQQQALLRFAGIVSLVDEQIVGARVVDEMGLQGQRGLRVIAVMTCVTRSRQAPQTTFGLYSSNAPAGSASPEVFELTPRFLVVPASDAQIERIAELEQENCRALGRAEKAELQRTEAERAMTSLAASLERVKAQLAMAQGDLTHARKQAEEARQRARLMEQDLGKIRGELGEKECRRILGDHA